MARKSARLNPGGSVDTGSQGAATPLNDSIVVPFTVAVDSNEYTKNHHGYVFKGLISNVDTGSKPLTINVQTENLFVGDYSIVGHPEVIIERKTKSDLYQSIAKRENFEERLRIMSDCYEFSAVVVEAGIGEILKQPPPLSSMSPKSVYRTVLAWSIRYHCRWFFCPDRWVAENTTFRLLERFYMDHRDEKLNRSKICIIAYRQGIDARLDGKPIAECPFDPKDLRFSLFEAGWRYADTDIVQRGEEFPKIRLCNGDCYKAKILRPGGMSYEIREKKPIPDEFVVRVIDKSNTKKPKRNVKRSK